MRLNGRLFQEGFSLVWRELHVGFKVTLYSRLLCAFELTPQKKAFFCGTVGNVGFGANVCFSV